MGRTYQGVSLAMIILTTAELALAERIASSIWVATSRPRANSISTSHSPCTWAAVSSSERMVDADDGVPESSGGRVDGVDRPLLGGPIP
jgi:hypothetical protein